MAARSGVCQKCGARIRPTAQDMSVAAASRKHYWRYHREVMMAGVRKAAANRAKAKKAAARDATKKARR